MCTFLSPTLLPGENKSTIFYPVLLRHILGQGVHEGLYFCGYTSRLAVVGPSLKSSSERLKVGESASGLWRKSEFLVGNGTSSGSVRGVFTVVHLISITLFPTTPGNREDGSSPVP